MTHHRYRVLLLVLCCPLLWSARAGAVTPAGLKTSTPITQSGIQAINASVAGDVAKLTSSTPSTVSQGRKALIDESDSAAGATPAYQQAYATSVIAAMTPLLTDPKHRLNASVVLGGVAAKVSRTNSADLFEPIAKTMMKDKSWPVAYWGVKIARYALADALLNGNVKTTLASDIVTTVKGNDQSSDIVEEAYLALVLDGIRTDPAYGNCLAQTLPVMLDLVKWRTALYANGIPVAPSAESDPGNTLPIAGFGMLSQPANKHLLQETLKALGDLTAAQLTTILNANGAPDPALVDATERLGSAMTGFGLKLPHAALQTAGTEITKMGNNPQPPYVTKCINDLNLALAAAIAAAQ